MIASSVIDILVIAVGALGLVVNVALAAPQRGASRADGTGMQFERTVNQASPPVDLAQPIVKLPEATPIHEIQELHSADTQARGNIQVADEEWEAYKKKFNKSYENADEDKERRGLYLQNKRYVEEHNKKHREGTVSYSLGINQFSDRKPSEKPTSGLIRPADRLSKN